MDRVLYLLVVFMVLRVGYMLLVVPVVLIVLVVLCRVPNGAHGTVMLWVGYFTC